MPNIKISGLNTILADSAIGNAMGFQVGTGRHMCFALYKGIAATKAELNGSLNLDTFRRSDLLYSAKLPNQSKPNLGIAGGDGFVAAKASGNASWFMLCGINSGNTVFGAVVGDVSASPGDGKLVLTTTQITKGWMYRVPSYLSAFFPYSFSY